MLRNVSILSALLMCLVAVIRASDDSGCKLKVRAEENGLESTAGRPRGPAVIFGQAVSVPAFRLRFVDTKSGRTLTPNLVTLAYGWKWLEYPYPEHAWGAWSEASDVVACTNIHQNELTVPLFEVRPRGWYKGKFVRFPFARKPSFSGIDIVAVLSECSPRVTIDPEHAGDLQGRAVVAHVSCQGQSQVEYKK